MRSTTPSQTLLTTSGTLARSEKLVPVFQAFLHETVRDAQKHGRFLNLLSLMEHIGSRKIMASQSGGEFGEGLLQHMAEEARHAFFFKRQARRFSGDAMEGYTDANTLARNAGAMYFARLDAEVSKRVAALSNDTAAPYLAVSLIVELRACWAYPQYHAALEEAGLPLSLKSIVAEEDAHLEEMHANLFSMPGLDKLDLSELSAIETGLFEKLLGQMTQEQALAA